MRFVTLCLSLVALSALAEQESKGNIFQELLLKLEANPKDEEAARDFVKKLRLAFEVHIDTDDEAGERARKDWATFQKDKIQLSPRFRKILAESSTPPYSRVSAQQGAAIAFLRQNGSGEDHQLILKTLEGAVPFSRQGEVAQHMSNSTGVSGRNSKADLQRIRSVLDKGVLGLCEKINSGRDPSEDEWNALQAVNNLLYTDTQEWPEDATRLSLLRPLKYESANVWLSQLRNLLEYSADRSDVVPLILEKSRLSVISNLGRESNVIAQLLYESELSDQYYFEFREAALERAYAKNFAEHSFDEALEKNLNRVNVKLQQLKEARTLEAPKKEELKQLLSSLQSDDFDVRNNARLRLLLVKREDAQSFVDLLKNEETKKETPKEYAIDVQRFQELYEQAKKTALPKDARQFCAKFASVKEAPAAKKASHSN